jgi:hypothetical protein
LFSSHCCKEQWDFFLVLSGVPFLGMLSKGMIQKTRKKTRSIHAEKHARGWRLAKLVS